MKTKTLRVVGGKVLPHGEHLVVLHIDSSDVGTYSPYIKLGDRWKVQMPQNKDFE